MHHPHWHYFVTLVESLERSARFVEIHQDNYPAYSTEYSHLILAACSEIDVVAKLLCLSADPASKVSNIDDYRKTLVQLYSSLATIEVTMPRYGITFAPWESWMRGQSPEWWRSYNRVKHQRDSHYKEANLENTIHSIGGLAVLVSYLYHEALSTHRFNPVPRFIFLLPKYSRGMVSHGQPSFHLPDFPKLSSNRQ